MPYKSAAAAAAYWVEYYARPETKQKNRAKVDAWRKRKPAKARAQARRNRASAREREALRVLAEAKRVTEIKRKAVLAEFAAQVERGYIGQFKPKGF